MSINISELEENINKQWIEKDIFKRSLEKNKSSDNFTFYDGPPFATGNPHYGHILAGSIKDTVCRHSQFKGYKVDRRAGWDCHGLPIEYEIEKQLGIKNYQEIIDFGIENYNNECRKIVLRCSNYWKEFMTRFGRWIDFENDYKTMDFDFMQSVWKVFKQLWDKDLVYQSFKVMPYSTACGTPLSNFEANSNYKLVNEESVIVKFKSKTRDFYYLVWTTTPWTLPCNMMLCLNPNLDYSVYTIRNENYLVCDSLVADIFGEGKKRKIPNELIKGHTYKGYELKDDLYNPIFNFYEDMEYKVTCDTFVQDTSGTGVVHIAPAFGEDDFKVCLENKIIGLHGEGIRCPVDRNGCFTDPLPAIFKQRNVKECDKDLIELLKKDNNLFKRMNTSHQYPFCWRSETPLIYKAVPSLFVSVTKLKKQMLKNCDDSNWNPDSVKSKRFRNWLEEARDWGISRNRIWGTPIPVWTDGEEYICIGSVEELEKLSGLESGKINDIHRENIDSIQIKSPKTGNLLTRVEYVFDCWFESGCMPFASQNYHLTEDIKFPADFIAEGLDQTRGWFYTLLIIGTALKNQAPFKNVIVNGLVLAEDGKKMSKRLNNYPDPMEIINKYGADALRCYLLSSPAVKADSLKFKEDGVGMILKTILIPLINSYKFYSEQKQRYELFINDKINYNEEDTENVFDRWIIYQFINLKKDIISDLDNYVLNHVCPKTQIFIEKLNNTYIKLNRDRIKGKITKDETLMSLKTLGLVLYNLSLLFSSYLPHFSEYLFQNMKDDFKITKDSVHLLSYNDFYYPHISYTDNFDKIDILIKILELVRVLRNNLSLPIKRPVIKMLICSSDTELKEKLHSFEHYLIKEGNILSLEYDNIYQYSQITYSPNLAIIGTQFKQDSKQVIKYLNSLTNEEIKNRLDNNNFEFNLNEEHLNINRQITPIGEYVNTINDDDNLLIYLDLEEKEEIIYDYIGKLIASNIQKFRKELGLKAWDKIEIYLNSDDEIIELVVNKNYNQIYEIVQNKLFINNKNIEHEDNTKSVDILDYNISIQIFVLNSS